MSFRVLVTGSRDWVDRLTIWRALDHVLGSVPSWQHADPPALVVVHGDADGADRWARLWARPLGPRVIDEPHPVTDADWTRHGRGAGPRRNAAMVAKGADLGLAFFAFGARNAGTTGCARLMRGADIPLRCYGAVPAEFRQWAA